MEKICAAIVFLSVYQLAGMLDYHDAPVLTKYMLDNSCYKISRLIGIHSIC